jgi:hypothetical protein
MENVKTEITKYVLFSHQHPVYNGVSFESKSGYTEREIGFFSRIINSSHKSTNNSLFKSQQVCTHIHNNNKKIYKEILKKDNKQKSQIEKVNYSTNIITRKLINSDSTRHAKSSQKTNTQKYHNNRINRKNPKKERKASCLALNIFSKTFMEISPLSLFPSSSQRTPSNIGFKNPLPFSVLSNNFKINKIFVDSAISTVCAPHNGDSRIKILIFSD